ncbi:hypothetical protein [Liquorilactobacillus nagelii]|uniref:hypothetical protein n=1 Tax=Liquorilactobacillus nagelii TaxID=82688 RepID=UPI00242E7F42|nr:hypothetical protein [Liquorilactobacillus nagelii]MCI1699187.1 hypothetical protein [Liquorilactobacillus nagelii]
MHKYLIKLSDEQYQRLKIIAKNKHMSDVVNRGINSEWIYYQSVQKTINELPKFKSLDDVQKWRVKQFNDSPELMAKYLTPAAILTYTQELKKLRISKQYVVDNQETIAYLIQQIANNINHLVCKNKEGTETLSDSLDKITNSVIKLSETIEEVFKGVT